MVVSLGIALAGPDFVPVVSATLESLLDELLSVEEYEIEDDGWSEMAVEIFLSSEGEPEQVEAAIETWSEATDGVLALSFA